MDATNILLAAILAVLLVAWIEDSAWLADRRRAFRRSLRPQRQRVKNWKTRYTRWRAERRR